MSKPDRDGALRLAIRDQKRAAVGAIDAIVAEKNLFVASRSFTPDQILERLNGTASTVPLFAAPMFW